MNSAKKKPKKIAGIILGAGSSLRMGKTKQLLPFGNTTILGRVVQNIRQSSLDEIIVVLGHDADKIQQTIDFSGTTIVLNKEYQKGQSTSLKAGLKKISIDCDGVMFILGDQPIVTADIIDHLIHVFKTSSSLIVIPYFKGRRGNPAIIPKSLFHRLKLLSGDFGARTLFAEFKDIILKVPVPNEAILVDVDTKEDYENLMLKIS